MAAPNATIPELSERTQEERIGLAIAAIHASGLNAKGKPSLSLRKAAKAYNISRSTLRDRFNGNSFIPYDLL